MGRLEVILLEMDSYIWVATSVVGYKWGGSGRNMTEVAAGKERVDRE